MKTAYLKIAAIAMATVSTPALAQDAETYDGLYVGGTISLDAIDNGASGLSFDVNRNGVFGDRVSTVTGADAFAPGFCSGAANGNAPAAGCTADDDDIGYSVRVGFDQRVGSFVGGLLVEGSMSDAVDAETSFSSTPASYTYFRNVDKSIALRGRLGVSPGEGRGLLYVTGGVAYADIDRDFSTTNGANSFTLDADGDDMVLGGQIGAGGEILLGGAFTLGAEYLFSRYEDDEAFVAVGAGTAGPTNPFLLASGGTNLRPADNTIDLHSFRITAGFQF